MFCLWDVFGMFIGFVIYIGFLWEFMGFCGNLWYVYGILWDLMEFLWDFMGLHGG